MMTFKESIKTVYGKYTTTSGRATRAEYWWFQLYVMLVFAALSIILIPLISAIGDDAMPVYAVSIVLFYIFNICPLFCVTIRRLHDSGRSGLSFLWGLIPYIGALIIIFMMCAPSDKDNEYGTIDGKEIDTSIEKTDIDL